MSDDRPSVYMEDGAVILRASSAFTECPRAVALMATDEQPGPNPPWLQQAYDRGHAVEDRINDMWEQRTGIVTEDRQAEFNLFLGRVDGVKVYARCHLDGRLVMHGGKTIVIREYKSAAKGPAFDRIARVGVEAHDPYPWQVAVQMWSQPIGADVACEFVVAEIETLGGGSGDAWIVERVECLNYLTPPITFRAVRDRGMQVAEWFLHPDRSAACNDKTPCRYEAWHDAPVILYNTDTGLRAQMVELADIAARLRVARGETDALTRAKKELETQVRDRMAAENATAREMVDLASGVTVKVVEYVTPAHTVAESTTRYLKITKR